ncbi:MAG: hypothetical protein JWO69_1327 [Thermoleophilia bacterium]|jgi:hypothetical protein|nr:hypothetical protein [Thermoleophilia bacterium]
MSAQRTWSGGASIGTSERTGPERRRVDRIDTVIRATVRRRGPGITFSKARVVDICDHGARLLLRRGFELGEELTLDLECEVPLRVHLGFDAHSLVIDGPMHTQLVELIVTVVRAERLPNRLWEIGVEFAPTTAFEERQFVQSFVDHLRELESWHEA